jgi:hypothetical protein
MIVPGSGYTALAVEKRLSGGKQSKSFPYVGCRPQSGRKLAYFPA